MERSTLIGIIVGLVMVIGGAFLTSFDLGIYGDIQSVFITIGGSFASLMVATPSARLKKLRIIIGLTFQKKEVDASGAIETLVTFAEKARKEGVLSLEDDVEEISEEFLKKAIQLMVDGTDPDIIKKIMYNEIDQMEERHKEYRQMLDDWGYFAPAFGMIGTLIGLVAMLNKMEDKSSIGKGMSTALITTLYGAIMANLIFLPMSSKLNLYNSLDVLMKEIIVEGVLSIQAGDNPAILRERLNSFIALSAQQSKEKEE